MSDGTDPDQSAAERETGSAAKESTESDTTPEPKEPVDDLVTTHHTLRVGRRQLRYTATTGRA